MTKEIHAVLTDMPTTISAFVRKNADSSYTIVLNSRMSSDRQLKAYMHELEHIKNNDFEKENADKIEMERHFGKKEKPLTDEEIKERFPASFKYLNRLRKRRTKAQKELEQYENEMKYLEMIGVMQGGGA